MARLRWLRGWDDIRDMDWQDIQLGNGASIAFDRQFDYRSLMRVAMMPTTQNHLEQEDVAIFEEFGTEDFEHVLRLLYQAMRINNIFELDTRRHRERYDGIRNALVGAIGEIHPEFHDIDEPRLRAASDFLADFERVFTTNYDLLLYWIIMFDPDTFGDFFWGGICDQHDVEIRPERTAVIYLHGALFLFLTEDGAVQKITAGSADLLGQIRAQFEEERVPVFVSEGESRQKMSAIRGRDYLTFRFGQLRTSTNNLVIFGHSLSEQDEHVIKVINLSRRENIAYAVRPNGKSIRELQETRARIERTFDRKRVNFFDSNSFPVYGTR